MTKLLSTALIAGLVTLAPGAAAAFDVNPVVSVIELPRDRSGITLTVHNPRTVHLPVLFEVVERTVHEDGTESAIAADDQFLIFPPQAVIPPGATQNVRVQWVGAPPSQSRSFTFFAAEQPVDLTGKTGVQTIFRMGASVHVTPADARPAPKLLAAKAEEGGVRVTIANEGSRFFYVESLSLDFSGTKLSGLKLADIAQRTLVPPGARRSFVVPNVSGTPELTTVQ
jgi:P pilus assembly chaperone PapD